MARRFAWYAVAGASAANVALLLVWDLLFQYRSADAYFLVLGPHDVEAAILNVAVAGLACGVIGVTVERSASRWVRGAGGALLLLAVLLVANALRQELRLTPNDAGQWIGAVGPRAVAALAIAAAGLLAALLWRHARRIAPALVTAAVIASPFLAVTLLRAGIALVRGDLAARFADRPKVPRLARADATAPRVVVLVFDELDYRLAFGARPAKVELPAFDALARAATIAVDARSPAPNTNEAMPSLLTGQPFDRTLSLDAREARLRLAGGETWRSSDSLRTFLARAHDRGANAALVGWNVPYCRTALGDGLAACDWWPSGVLLGRPASLLATMWGQWVAASPLNGRVVQRWRHEGMLATASARVADAGLDLVVVHLVPPHYPFIWDAAAHRYTLSSVGARGYLGNLALADTTLSTLRAALQRSGLANRTVLVVTADHPWRTSREFDGGADPRVPFLVHLPGDSSPDTVSARFETIHLGDLVASALRGDLRDRAAVRQWFAARRPPEGSAP